MYCEKPASVSAVRIGLVAPLLILLGLFIPAKRAAYGPASSPHDGGRTLKRGAAAVRAGLLPTSARPVRSGLGLEVMRGMGCCDDGGKAGCVVPATRSPLLSFCCSHTSNCESLRPSRPMLMSGAASRELSELSELGLISSALILARLRPPWRCAAAEQLLRSTVEPGEGGGMAASCLPPPSAPTDLLVLRPTG